MYRCCLFLSLSLFLSACTGSIPILQQAVVGVVPLIETTPVQTKGDAADDPAIWVHPIDASKSLVLGTDKHQGLAVYNLQGQQTQFLARGHINNVDLRQGVSVNGASHDIAVATNRTTGSIDIFSITPNAKVIFEQAQSIAMPKLYGICLYRRGAEDLVAFVNNKQGSYQQWLLNPQGQLAPQMEGEFILASKSEGCVVNDSTNTLYFGEEDLGVWKMQADYNAADERVLIAVVGDGNLSADIEGLAIYYGAKQSMLMVSSQGSSSYALYDLANDNYLASVCIDKNTTAETPVDGVQQTDGIALSSVNFGGEFSQGLFVAQDGYNTRPIQNQNFKFIPWSEVEQVLKAK